MSLNLRNAVCCSILAVGLAAALGTSAVAQGNIRSVTFYTVKGDRVGDFLAEIKQYNALLAKGGSTRTYTMWLSLTGPRTYAQAVYYKTWADLDAGADPKMKEQATDLARISMRINDCTEGSRRVIEEINPDLSMPDSGTIPKMIRVLVTEVKPNNVNDYLALAKSEIFPGIKKSGAKDYSLARGRFGEPSSVITSVTGINDWADFDGGVGLEKGIGKEAYQKFLLKLTPLIASSEWNVYRYQPEISYVPEGPAK